MFDSGLSVGLDTLATANDLSDDSRSRRGVTSPTLGA
jgi:hypothetical protein